jgi:hypothetical protein
MNIFFYNAWHNGDLHVSRTFIRYILENIKADSYNYLHSNSTKILQDIVNLNQLPFKNEIIDKNSQDGYLKKNQNYYINTWYGSYNFDYLRNKEMNIFVLFNIFKRTLKELFDHEILNDPLYFLPKIDYTKFDIKNVDNFILKDKRRKVLICNNNVDSGQSENFSFDPIIEKLSKDYPNILFIVSNIFKDHIIEKNNIFYCNRLCSNIYDNNLNEIGYLSKFCDVVVGRYSGPQSFAGTYENFLDTSKTFINFVKGGSPNGYDYGDCSFGITSILPKENRAKFVSSKNFATNDIINVIKGELK